MDSPAPIRKTLRNWIAEQRAMLEQAQEHGSLARTKLDVKDAAREQFAAMAGTPEFNSILDEELEAFCSDMRLASVTVQNQIERKTPHTLRAVILALLAGFVALFVTALNVRDPALGFGLPIVVMVVVFFLAR